MNPIQFYKDKVVLITGSSMGIGKEIARQILDYGGKVVITGRNKDRLAKVSQEFEKSTQNILIHVSDASNYEDNLLLVKKIINRFGKLDVLITNAAISCYGEVGKVNPEVVRQVINTNIYGSLFPVMALLEELKKTRGSVLFISSVAGFYGVPGYSAYSLSKMSLKALSDSLKIELKKSGVFVGITYVGFTENEENKVTLSPTGKMESPPMSPKLHTSTRAKTARRITLQIMNKKHSDTHSVLGIFTREMSRFFPFILGYFLSGNYHKKKPRVVFGDDHESSPDQQSRNSSKKNTLN